MVAPIVIAAVAGGVMLAGAGATAALRPIRNIAGLELAILGGEDVGKSTLLEKLRSAASADSGNSGPGKFWLGSGRKRLKLEVLDDLRGADGIGMPAWKSAFMSADHVWYLFRADLVARGDREEVARLESQLALLNHWRTSKRRGKPKVVLVGTWSDLHPEFANDPKRFARGIRSDPVVSVAAAKLGGARVVAGSLSTAAASDSLIEQVGDS